VPITSNVSSVSAQRNGNPPTPQPPNLGALSQTPPTADAVVFCPANKLSFDPRPQMAKLFVEGFSQWFIHVSNDSDKLERAFAPGFQLDTFFVALGPDNRVLAMVGSPVNLPSLILDKEAFAASLGKVRGRLGYLVLKKFFTDSSYPFNVEPGMGSIEFVVADPAIRGHGITGHLIEFTMAQRGYASYVLEVASNNTRALKLYQRLGFKEFMRKPASKRSGVGEFIYLRNDQNSSYL